MPSKEDRFEKVVETARAVFVRQGYRRTTMGDLASAAALSRPALYLVFESKEAVFNAVLDRVLTDALADARVAIAKETAIERRLEAAFEVWSVRPFRMILAAPDAGDLLASSQTFAADVVGRHLAAFERLVARQLASAAGTGARLRLSTIRIARLMVAAVAGFKQSAGSVAHLRQMIEALVAIVLASLRTDARA